jgi:hypothetical protein
VAGSPARIRARRHSDPGGDRPVGLGDVDAQHGPHPAPLQPGPAPPGQQGQGQHQDPDPDDQQARAEGQADGQDGEPGQADEHAGQQVDRGRPGAELERRAQHPPDPPASRRPRRLLDRHRPLLGCRLDLARSRLSGGDLPAHQAAWPTQVGTTRMGRRHRGVPTAPSVHPLGACGQPDRRSRRWATLPHRGTRRRRVRVRCARGQGTRVGLLGARR